MSMMMRLCRSLGRVATRSGIARAWTARSRTYSSRAARPGASAAFPPAERTIAGRRSAGSWCLPGFAVAASISFGAACALPAYSGNVWVLSRCPEPFLILPYLHVIEVKEHTLRARRTSAEAPEHEEQRPHGHD